MDDLLREVERTIERYALLRRGERIIVGVSGGPDSLTLLDLLQRLAGRWGWSLHVAHLDHGLRPESAAEADFVRALAEARGLPITVERAELPARVREGVAVEETARRYRYAFLARVAVAEGATAIAVGHNADDQAETVLMHLLRGSGLDGLRGMLPSRPLRDYRLLPSETPPADLRLVRPLLFIPRARIEAYCRRRGLRPLRDPSNAETTFFRNRLRHEVFPCLEEVAPRFRERLTRLAEVVRADAELLHQAVDAAWSQLLREEGTDWLDFDLRGWREAPLAIRRALIRRAAYRLRPSLRDVDFVHVEAAEQVAQAGETGAVATLPGGLRLTVGYDGLTIGAAEAERLPRSHPWLEAGMEVSLPPTGSLALGGGWRVEVERLHRWSTALIRQNSDPLTAWVDAEALGDAPLLRTRRRGDRFHPQGMPGPMRLSDFFINLKLPRRLRDRQPLLVGSRGTIVWVVGYRLAEPALVREGSRAVVRLTFRREPNADEERCLPSTENR